MKASPTTHIVQGSILLVIGGVLLFTPLYEWGWLIVPLSAAYLVYGIIRSMSGKPKPGSPSMPPQNHHKTSGMLLAPFLMGTLLACLASCGDEGNGPASQAPASSATKTIRNSEFRFTIQVPSNWRVDERPPVPPGSRVFRPLIEAVSSSDIRAVLQVRCGPKVPAEATSEAIAKEIAQGHLSHNRSLRVTHGTGRVSGREVWWTDTVTPGEDWRHRAYWLIVRSTVFEVAVSSTDSGFAGVEPLLTRIVESMQFD